MGPCTEGHDEGMYYLQGGDESLRPIHLKTFPVLFVILSTTNTIILGGDYFPVMYDIIYGTPCGRPFRIK
jgi:hypothetical protein